MRYKNFVLLTYSETYPVGKNRKFTLADQLATEEELNKLIDAASAETNFTKWLKNWDAHHDERASMTSRTTFSVLNLLNFSVTDVEIKFIEKEVFYMLNNSNDLDEWIDFVQTGYAFAARLTELFYNAPILRNKLPDFVLENVYSLQALTNLLDEKGVVYNLSRSRLPRVLVLKENLTTSRLSLNNSVRICLVGDYTNPEELLSTKSDAPMILSEETILINSLDLKKKIEERGVDLLNAIRSKSLSSLYGEERVIPDYDSKSYSYSVDLSWNDDTKQKMYESFGYELYKSHDGYIAKKLFKNPNHTYYFRPSLKELKEVLNQ